jgi:hypothetical protein
MEPLAIEEILGRSAPDLSSKYFTLKTALSKGVYPFWQVEFRGGNDHGWGHIERVLEKLIQLLGDNFLDRRIIGIYELYLSMMGVLLHDIGMLANREEHAPIGGEKLVEKIPGTGDFRIDNHSFIFDPPDRKILKAIVVSHSRYRGTM